MASDAMRAEFEAWLTEDGKWPAAAKRSGDGYILAYAQSAWTVWQAARRTPAPEVAGSSDREDAELLTDCCEIINQLIACHEEPDCPAIKVGREIMARIAGRSLKESPSVRSLDEGESNA